MKKKIIFTIMIVVIILGAISAVTLLILTDKNEEDTQDISSDPIKWGNDLEENLIDWMKAGTFTIEFSISSVNELGEDAMGNTLPICSLSAQGNNTALSVYENLRIISIDTETYIVDDENKVITESESFDVGFSTTFPYIKLTGSGTGTVDGKELYYETYEQGGFSDYILKFYIEDNQVYAIEAQTEIIKTLMIIKSAKNTVPAGVFNIPTERIYTNNWEY